MHPAVDKVRVFYNHPDFIAANAERVREALDALLPSDRRQDVHLAFTAHSIPVSMARNCKYEHQLTETCRLIAEEIGIAANDGRLSTKAGAAGRVIRGSSPISSIISRTYGGGGSERR